MRWNATVVYRSENGPLNIEHQFEELEELHDIVERGPDWNCISFITITLARKTAPGLTIEKAEQS